jgi:hypothetical protein
VNLTDRLRRSGAAPTSSTTFLRLVSLMPQLANMTEVDHEDAAEAAAQ